MKDPGQQSVFKGFLFLFRRVLGFGVFGFRTV